MPAGFSEKILCFFIQPFWVDSKSVSYSVGGMTIGIADADVSNASYTSGRTIDETSVSLSIAF